MDEKKSETHIAVFNGKSVRRKFVEDKWFFSVVDVVGILSGSPRPRKYWFDLKVRLVEEGSELSAKIGQLKLKSGDGKEYETDCADTEGIFRIVQSIPSKKAEPFKRWLARVGYERVLSGTTNMSFVIYDDYVGGSVLYSDGKIYKEGILSSADMFPSDLSGSLDDFFLGGYDG